MVAQIERGAIAVPIILQTLDDYVEIESRFKDELSRLRLDHMKLCAAKRHTDRIKGELKKIEREIKAYKDNLAELEIMKTFSPGQWVRNKSSKPGKIESLQLINKKLQVMVTWWLDKVPVPESVRNLSLVPNEDMKYVWLEDKNGYPKLIRKCDRFECEDLQVLNQELTKLSQSQTREAVYLKKRIQLFGGNSERKLSIISKCFSKPEIKTIAIADIQQDPDMQQRIGLDDRTVAEYKEAMIEGAKFPPVKIKWDGDKYWLYDGFHTIAAAIKIKLLEIEAEVTQGNKRDAILASVGVNFNHGLRRTNEDKRKAVITLLQDDEWGGWSNRKIAKYCKVTEGLVRKIKKEKEEQMNGCVQYALTECTSKEDASLRQDIETAETDKLNNEIINKRELLTEKPETDNKPKFEVNQLVQLKLSSMIGVSEKVKSLNHSYGLVRGMTETKTGYNVLVFGQQSAMTSSYTVKAEDLKPIESVSFCTEFSAEEFIKLMLKHHSRDSLEKAIREEILNGIK